MKRIPYKIHKFLLIVSLLNKRYIFNYAFCLFMFMCIRVVGVVSLFSIASDKASIRERQLICMYKKAKFQFGIKFRINMPSSTFRKIGKKRKTPKCNSFATYDNDNNHNLHCVTLYRLNDEEVAISNGNICVAVVAAVNVVEGISKK